MGCRFRVGDRPLAPAVACRGGGWGRGACRCGAGVGAAGPVGGDVQWPGRAAARDGPRALRRVPGVPVGDRRGVRRGLGCSRPTPTWIGPRTPSWGCSRSRSGCSGWSSRSASRRTSWWATRSGEIAAAHVAGVLSLADATPAGGGAGPVDGRVARRWGDARHRGHRSRSRRHPRRPGVPGRGERRAGGRRVGGSGRGRCAGGPLVRSAADAAVAGEPRVPFGPDGTDARRVPPGLCGLDVPSPGDPDRVERHGRRSRARS